MDRNTLIGFFLMGVLLILFSIYNQSPEKKHDPSKKMEDSTLVQNKKAAPSDKTITTLPQDTLPDSLKRIAAFGTFASAAQGTDSSLTVENEFMKVTFSSKGGGIEKVELRNYKTYHSKPLILFDKKHDKINYTFLAGNKKISTGDLYFQVIGQPFIIKEKQKKSIIFRLPVQNGAYLEQKYTLTGNSYTIDHETKWVGLTETINPSVKHINLEWKSDVQSYEKHLETEKITSTIYYNYNDENADYLSETENEELKLANTTNWVSFKQQFFNKTIINKNGFESGKIKTTVTADKSKVKTLVANLAIPFDPAKDEVINLQYYFGPNHYKTLAAFDNDLHRIIPLGWGIFGWVNKFMVIPIFNFLDDFIGNYGLIILLLTFIIKIILFFPTYKSFLSAAKMKVLQPEIAELKAKYPDPQAMNAEQLKLFQRAGVNPLAGCIPMLASMPILIAMYSFFPASIELRQEAFLWAEDISTYDSILNLGFNIPFYGDHVSLFTLLMTASTLVYTYYNSQMTEMAAHMKWMQYLMPVMFLGIFNSSPAALSYYYFLFNIISIGQQIIIKNYIVDEAALHKKIQENKLKPVKKSGFQQKLEEMAKARDQKGRKK